MIYTILRRWRKYLEETKEKTFKKINEFEEQYKIEMLLCINFRISMNDWMNDFLWISI